MHIAIWIFTLALVGLWTLAAWGLRSDLPVLQSSKDPLTAKLLVRADLELSA